MSDTISRQAAIEYLMTNMNWYDEDGYESDDDYKRECITELINGVPSAQPDAIPLEWIAKHLEWLDNCDNDFAQLAKVSIKAMVELWKKDRI